MISTDKDFEVFGNFVAKFGMGKLQDIVNIKKYLESNEYSIDDIEGYVEWEIKKVEDKLKDRQKEFEDKVLPARKKLVESLPKCPECGGSLGILHIKEEEGNGNIHGYKSLWQCGDKECVYEKYNMEPRPDILVSLIGEENTRLLGFIK